MSQSGPTIHTYSQDGYEPIRAYNTYIQSRWLWANQGLQYIHTVKMVMSQSGPTIHTYSQGGYEPIRAYNTYIQSRWLWANQGLQYIHTGGIEAIVAYDTYIQSRGGNKPIRYNNTTNWNDIEVKQLPEITRQQCLLNLMNDPLTRQIGGLGLHTFQDIDILTKGQLANKIKFALNSYINLVLREFSAIP